MLGETEHSVSENSSGCLQSAGISAEKDFTAIPQPQLSAVTLIEWDDGMSGRSTIGGAKRDLHRPRCVVGSRNCIDGGTQVDRQKLTVIDEVKSSD